MPDPVLYLKSMMIAAGASALLVLAFGWRRVPASSRRMNAICISGIGLGLALGYPVLLGSLRWPPVNALGRLLMIVMPAVFAMELVTVFLRPPAWCGSMLRIAFSMATARILLHGSVWLVGFRVEAPFHPDLLLACCGGLLALVWELLMILSRRGPGIALPLSLAQSILCTGLLVMMAGYVTGGAAAFPLFAALLGAIAISTWIAHSNDWQGSIGIAVVGLFSLACIGRFFGGLSTGCAVTVLLSPLLCWVPELPPLRRQSPWLVATLRLTFSSVPLMIALALAKRDFDRSMGPLLGSIVNPAIVFCVR